MSYSDYLNTLIRTRVTLIKIYLDTCSREFGVSPCLATGSPCYKTIATCKYKAPYNKTSNVFRFCSQDIVILPDNCRPYLTKIDYAATELKEDKTVPQRVSLQFCDDFDTDVATDPYWLYRGLLLDQVTGTFWKKLIARNSNIKGKIVEIFEGFDGLAEADFVMTFRGKIDEFEDNGGSVTIKCIDLLQALDAVKYPIQSSCKLSQDIGAYYPCYSEQEMLQLPVIADDFAIRKDFLPISLTLTQTFTGSDAEGHWYYQIIGYDIYDNPIAYGANDNTVGNGDPDGLSITWLPVSGVSYYRLFGRSEGDKYYHQYSTPTTVTDSGQDDLFPSFAVPETAAYRLFRFSGGLPGDLTKWIKYSIQSYINLTGTTGLNSSGYIKIEEEIIYYGSKDASTIYNTKRIQLDTKPARHLTGAVISLLVCETPDNPYTLAKKLLTTGNVGDYIDTTAFNALESAWTGINFSAKPILKETNLAVLYFDLVNMLDAKSWVNESGLISIKMNSDITVSRVITDESHIIQGSCKIISNQKDIKTRLSLYWDRLDMTKGITDKESFANLTINADADAESANEYDDEINQDFYTVWINSDCGTIDELNSYIDDLLTAKLQRKRSQRPCLLFDIELKDSAIKVGDMVQLETDELNDVSGDNYQYQIFEIIKKESKDNRITLTAQFRPPASDFAITAVPVILKRVPAPIISADNVGINVSGANISSGDSIIDSTICFVKNITFADFPNSFRICGIVKPGYLLESVHVKITTPFSNDSFIEISDDSYTIVSPVDLPTNQEADYHYNIFKSYNDEGTFIAQFTGTPTAGAAQIITKICKKIDVIEVETL